MKALKFFHFLCSKIKIKNLAKCHKTENHLPDSNLKKLSFFSLRRKEGLLFMDIKLFLSETSFKPNQTACIVY